MIQGDISQLNVVNISIIIIDVCKGIRGCI